MVSRRDFLKGAAGVAAGAMLEGDVSPELSADNAFAFPDAARNENAWRSKLTEALPKNVMNSTQRMVVEGKLPAGLKGKLLRNGPGLFERPGEYKHKMVRKEQIIDGDGMIRMTEFGDDHARFSTRMVETAKFKDEEKAGRFLYPTWTTRAPGGIAENFMQMPTSQAGVSVVARGDRLYAFDEVGLPWGVDPNTLHTIGEMNPNAGDPNTKTINFKAHTKTTPDGNWVLTGQRGNHNPELHVMEMDAAGKKLSHVTHPKPRGEAYFHDFFWAKPYAVFSLQPMETPTIPVALLSGMRPYADCLDWKPEKGGQLYVVDTTGAKPPVTIDVPACWMWHTANAYRDGNKIIADFVGYDTPDHFIGKDPAFHAIMQGRDGVANSPGTLRRYTIDLDTKQAKMETVAKGRFEFPVVAPGKVGQPYQYTYLASSDEHKGILQNGIARVDMNTGEQTAFHFGKKFTVSEPIYAPNPDFPPGDEKNGWILAEVLDGQKGKSFVAVFEASRIQDGPVAKVWLSHHLPISFHGCWQPESDVKLASNEKTGFSR